MRSELIVLDQKVTASASLLYLMNTGDTLLLNFAGLAQG